jgi:hypothetical protein
LGQNYDLVPPLIDHLDDNLAQLELAERAAHTVAYSANGNEAN